MPIHLSILVFVPLVFGFLAALAPGRLSPVVLLGGTAVTLVYAILLLFDFDSIHRSLSLSSPTIADHLGSKAGTWLEAIETGEQTVVGVNAYTETEPSPLTEAGMQSILVVDESAEREQIEALHAFKSRRSDAEVEAALRELDDVLASGANVMPVSIRAAHAGVTTGEWSDTLRRRFGEYRAPTGVVAGESAAASDATAAVRERVHALESTLGRPLKLLVGKPGLDGHSNGAEQIAVKARDVGMEVVYEGIRLTPEEIAASARDEGVHVVGLSILSGSHGVLVLDVLERLRPPPGA